MKRVCLSAVVGVGLIVLVCPASAQLASKNKPDAKTEATRIANDRRAQARSLLISLATDARTFRDLKLRARSLARIADVLWSVDAEQGRALFRKAWEAAETADETHGPYRLGEWPVNIRGEVLAMSAKRDRRLAEEFLQKLAADQKEANDEPSTRDPQQLPEAQRQRLALAESLLRSGDIERALQFADPVLRSVTVSTITFLTNLREHNPTAADQRYSVLLANTRDNMLADANTISCLSSYIFTPQAYVIFSPEGSASAINMPSMMPPADVDPQLRLTFFRTAAAVLLRPQPDPSATGVTGKYLAVKHLMPLFDQYAPKEIAAALHGQLEALNSIVSTAVRQGEIEEVQNPDTSFSDQQQSLLDKVEAAKASAERDELYFKLALLAVGKNDLKARDYASKIDESWLRRQAYTWVDWALAKGAIKQKKPEAALEFARTSELTPIQRVWILTQSAKLLAKSDRDKALFLIDEATSELSRLDGSDLDRPRGFLAIANALRLIEPTRVWEAMFAAIKTANSTGGFTGEDGALILTINSRGGIWTTRDVNPDFDIAGIFGELAQTDYEQTVQLARGFQDEAPRANAAIAIARSLLSEKRSTPKN